ncbi:MAG TPA: cytochrome D1 domain-containing protein [Sphingomicrobium sp.]|nr:cytochrome D1 domain-containing protein [Sphingomicrobium sp.]
MIGRNRRWGAVCAAVLLGCSGPSAAQGDGEAAVASGGPVLLVGNKGEDTVSFIDLASGRELARVATGRMPHEIAVSPDGKQAAVVAYGGTTVDLFEVASRTKLKTIDLQPNAGPHGIAWLADGRLVVTTERSQSVAVVDPAAGKLVASLPTGQQGTHMVAVSADGTRAYTANIPAGTVSVLDLTAGRKLRDIAVGGNPEGIALSRDGRVLWVADLEAPRVQAFDAASFEKLGEVATGAAPIRVAASPDGRWIVTSNLGGGSLTVIDAATRTKVKDIAVSGDDEAGQVTILFADDGKLYAAETGRDMVAEVDLESGQVLRRIPAGKNGDGLAIAPGGR